MQSAEGNCDCELRRFRQRVAVRVAQEKEERGPPYKMVEAKLDYSKDIFASA